MDNFKISNRYKIKINKLWNHNYILSYYSRIIIRRNSIKFKKKIASMNNSNDDSSKFSPLIVR